MNINYDVSVFIITRSGQYVEFSEFDKRDDSGVFVCITNERLNNEFGFNNSICIHRDWRLKLRVASKYIDLQSFSEEPNGQISVIWQKESLMCVTSDDKYRFDERGMTIDDQEDYLINYLDGYLTCQNIMTNISPLLYNSDKGERYTMEKYIPAIMLAYHTRVKFNGLWYNGYLPAIGQLMFIFNNLTMVGPALKAIGGDCFDIDERNSHGYWWSSTENNHASMWITCGIKCYGLNKGYLEPILPLFTVL